MASYGTQRPHLRGEKVVIGGEFYGPWKSKLEAVVQDVMGSNFEHSMADRRRKERTQAPLTTEIDFVLQQFRSRPRVERITRIDCRQNKQLVKKSTSCDGLNGDSSGNHKGARNFSDGIVRSPSLSLAP
jgi:hypothetical protein